MASEFAPWWKRLLFKTPLYKRGPICGNYHKRTDRYCYCCVGEHSGDWHGGVYDFKTGKEIPARLQQRGWMGDRSGTPFVPTD